MDPYIGEIRMFTGSYAPLDWEYCNGKQLYIQQNPALYSIIGCTYGGDYKTTFNLPNFMGGLVPMHWGFGPGLTPRTLPEKGGTINNKLTVAQMGSHNHRLMCTSVFGSSPNPIGNVFANRVSSDKDYVNMTQNPNAIDTTMSNISILPAGTSSPDPIPNIQPCMGIHFIICLNGIYPPKPTR